MNVDVDQGSVAEKIWRAYLVEGENEIERRQRRFFKFLPGSPRCKNCFAPFGGAGSAITRLFFNKRPSNMNPHICNLCEQFVRKYPGGAEVELTLLFADVRGSTSLAERLGTAQFRQLIDRFYQIASQILVNSDALIDKIIGDQAAGIFVPGLAGSQHAHRAIEAGRKLLGATGHGKGSTPWVPLGIGIHTGIAYVGSVGSSDGTMDITVLGDAANTAARLSSEARAGEILVSNATYQEAEIEMGSLEQRQLSLKGKSQTVSVYVLAD